MKRIIVLSTALLILSGAILFTACSNSEKSDGAIAETQEERVVETTAEATPTPEPTDTPTPTPEPSISEMSIDDVMEELEQVAVDEGYLVSHPSGYSYRFIHGDIDENFDRGFVAGDEFGIIEQGAALTYSPHIYIYELEYDSEAYNEAQSNQPLTVYEALGIEGGITVVHEPGWVPGPDDEYEIESYEYTYAAVNDRFVLRIEVWEENSRIIDNWQDATSEYEGLQAIYDAFVAME